MSEGPFDAALRERHIAESMQRMPGPTYYDVLGWIHETVRPANYLEIGVRHGFSLGNVLEETRTVAVDPNPLVTYPFPNLEIYGVTSDEFFAREDVDEILRGPIELAFIDGLHLFEQVVRDFINVERHSDRDTIALFHDPVP
ncbi:MAG: class I SAM-dependent methyltransferase, partial [Actinomycetota bacterium]|nr:class I SAM-dependent methyltransferase [Actinomycetota bacterium]